MADDQEAEEAEDNTEDLPEWFQEHVPPEIAESSLFRFNIKMPNGVTIPINLTQDIGIDFEILEQQHEQIPAQYIYWAALYSELRCMVTGLELSMRSKRKVIANMVSQKFKATGAKLTDKLLLELINGDDDLVRLEAKLAIAQKHCGKVYHMVQAIQLRSEHSRSLAGFKRQEKMESSRLT